MFCPQCKYTSFDHLPKCPKCSYDWSGQRKELNLSWLEAPESSPQEEHFPSFELEDEPRASSAANQEEQSAEPGFAARQQRSGQEQASRKAGPDYEELGREEPREQPGEAAMTEQGASWAQEPGEKQDSGEEVQEISFPELDDLFSSPEQQPGSQQDQPAASGEDADDIEPVLDFEPEVVDDSASQQPSSKAESEGEEEASQDELELDISSFIDDLEIEPGDSEETDQSRSGS